MNNVHVHHFFKKIIFSLSASGAYGKIRDCATRNQYQTVAAQANQGARFFDIDTRMLGNRVDTCHGIQHEVELSRVNILSNNF